MKLFSKANLATSIALALGISASANATLIDADGGGPEAAGDTATLVFSTGNAIATCIICNGVPGGSATSAAVGEIFQSFGHFSISALQDSTSADTSPGMNTDFEWTVIYGFTEAVVDTGAFPFPSATFLIIDSAPLAGFGAKNFFEIYYNKPTNASSLTGTGFNDGTLIMSGTFKPFDSISGEGFSLFSITGSGTPNLDGSGVDNYPGIDTLPGTGSVSAEVDIGFAHGDFFGALSSILLNFDTTINDPYTQTDPSACFYNKPGASDPTLAGGLGGAGACGVNPATIGALNFVSGPNNMFQTNGSASINGVNVPEPGSLALIGAAMAALGGVATRRRNKA